MEVIFEDNHLLVIAKPPGLTTQGAYDEPSVYSEAKAYLKEKYNKPGNVYLGIVSRLDKRVGGVLVLARTSKAAARLSKQFRENVPRKEYIAVVEGRINPTDTYTSLHDWLAKSERDKRMMLVGPDHAGAQQAKLRMRSIETKANSSLVEIQLHTGRKHQIRVQLEAIGHSIVGDSKYGSSRSFHDVIALHSRKLTLEHPTRKERLEFESSPPSTWNSFGFDHVR